MVVQTADFPYSEEERAFRADPVKLQGQRNSGEYWEGYLRFNKATLDIGSPEMAQIEALALKNPEDNVRDPALREKLRPTYRAMRKRLIFSPNYYEAVQRPGVSVETGRIACIEAAGIRMTDGRLHELDIIVLATGCKSWYLDAQGVPHTWPWTYAHFSEVMRRPKLEDYEIS